MKKKIALVHWGFSRNFILNPNFSSFSDKKQPKRLYTKLGVKTLHFDKLALAEGFFLKFCLMSHLLGVEKIISDNSGELGRVRWGRKTWKLGGGGMDFVIILF